MDCLGLTPRPLPLPGQVFAKHQPLPHFTLGLDKGPPSMTPT